MKLPRNVKIFRGQLDAAPFAGVTFLLLIFLLLSSKLVSTPVVRIELPEVSDRVPGISGPTVVVAIDQVGNLFYENQIITEEALMDRLRKRVAEATEPLTLEIQADKAGILERPAQLMNRARALGFRQAGFRLRPPVLPIAPNRADE